MITQMMLPTVLERMSISSNAPVGWPSSSVTTSAHRVDADRAGLGGEVHGLPGLGLEVDLLGRLDDQVVTGLCLDPDPHRLVEVVGDGHRERSLVGGEQHEAGRLDADLLQPGVEPARWTRRR